MTAKKPAPFYVYMVRCANGTLYTGTAFNVKKRVQDHNQGKGAKYTRAFGPVALIWKKKFQDRSTACREESRIKRLDRRRKLLLLKKPRKTPTSPLPVRTPRQVKKSS